MKRWDRPPETSSGLDPRSAEVTVNQISFTKPVEAGCFRQSQCKDGQANCEPRCWPGPGVQHGEPGGPGGPRPADTRGGHPCSCWDCGRDRCGAAAAAAAAAHRGMTGQEQESDPHPQSDEEELEPPLPLRSDDEWQHHQNPCLPPHHYRHSYGLPPTMDAHYYQSPGGGRGGGGGGGERERGQYDLSYPPPPHPDSVPCTHGRPWDDPHTWPRQRGGACDGLAEASVSVNMPHFSIPPADGVSQVGMMMRKMMMTTTTTMEKKKNQGSAGAEAPVSQPQERRQTISLPHSCRNIFITYSSDVYSEMVPFVDFLTKHGFHPAIDLFEDPVRSLDINKWKDTYLKDPSYLIIIAISPRYKADIQGSLVDSHGLHTKYIHSMMQNEFIQQGSLNFRFIPVLFLSASQKHVPSWLQNTRVYRWPHDTEDLLLRLLRVEKYHPPPVPVELTLIIRPVAPSAAATL